MYKIYMRGLPWWSMQGTPVQSLAWEDSTCHRATKSMWHNYCTRILDPKLHSKRSHCNEKPVTAKSGARSPKVEKACTAVKTQYSQKIIFFFNLYEENYKILMKNIKEELNKWRAILYSWTGRLNMVKMPVLPNLIHRFSTIPNKIPASYFANMGKLILK